MSVSLFLFLTMTSVTPSFAEDPISTARADSETLKKEVSYFKSPGDSRPLGTTTLTDFAEFRLVGYRGEEPERDLLVWEEKTVRSVKWLRVQKEKAAWVWIKNPSTEALKSVESHWIKGSQFLQLSWDHKLYESPGSENFKPFSEIPKELAVHSYLEVPPTVCKSSPDPSQPEVVSESCAPGPYWIVRDQPGGKPIEIKGRTGIGGPLKVRTTEAPAVFLVERLWPKNAERARSRLVVFDKKGNWVKVRTQNVEPYQHRWVWIQLTPEAGTWVKSITEAERKKTIDSIAELKTLREKESERTGWDSTVTSTRRIAGDLWVHLKVYTENYCETFQATQPAAEGWVLAFHHDELQVLVSTCD